MMAFFATTVLHSSRLAVEFLSLLLRDRLGDPGGREKRFYVKFSAAALVCPVMEIDLFFNELGPKEAILTTIKFFLRP